MKDVIRRVLRRTGYELRRYAPSSSDQARLAALLKAHEIDLVLDVGANDGGYSRGLRRIGYAGRIISFEPLTAVHEALVSASQHDPLWSVAPKMALGDTDGEAVIHVSDNLVSSSLRRVTDAATSVEPGVRQTREETVRVARLDSVFQELVGDSRNVYLKIDVQGFEDAVLKGAQLTLGQVKGLQMELSLKPMYQGQLTLWDMGERLRAHGFELHAMLPGYTDASTGRMIELDGIFFR